jgi:hypothetical protein
MHRQQQASVNESDLYFPSYKESIKHLRNNKNKSEISIKNYPNVMLNMMNSRDMEYDNLQRLSTNIEIYTVLGSGIFLLK